MIINLVYYGLENSVMHICPTHNTIEKIKFYKNIFCCSEEKYFLEQCSTFSLSQSILLENCIRVVLITNRTLFLRNIEMSGFRLA